IGRVDDQRVAFPTTARIAVQQAEVRSGMGTPVERDHAYPVHQLVPDRDGSAGLEDLQVVVVRRAEHGGTLVAPGDAAFSQTAKFGRVGWTAASRGSGAGG